MTWSGSLASSTARSILSAAAPLTRGRASTVPLCSTLRSVACVVSCSRSTQRNTSTICAESGCLRGSRGARAYSKGTATAVETLLQAHRLSEKGSGAHLGLLPHGFIVQQAPLLQISPRNKRQPACSRTHNARVTRLVLHTCRSLSPTKSMTRWRHIQTFARPSGVGHRLRSAGNKTACMCSWAQATCAEHGGH